MKDLKVLVAGALPPPYIGPTLATEIILESKLGNLVDVKHLDTSLNDSFDSLGKFSFKSVFLAVRSYYLLVKEILKFKPDVLYIQTTQSTLAYLKDSIYILIAALFRVKVVGHLRGSEFGSWYSSINPFLKRYVRFAHSYVSTQVVLGNNLKGIFKGVVSDEKISVVPNGKDIIIPDTERSSSAVKILFLANFKKRKGVVETLKAAEILKEKGIDFELIMAGASRDKEVDSFISEFVANNQSMNLNLVGAVNAEEKYNLISESDIFVFPPNEPEGHPWVLVEALAGSLPVVATDQGAIVESVINDENGFITTGTPENIAEKLLLLLGDSKLREEMGQQSRTLYEEKFTEDAMIYGLLDIFKRVAR